MSITLYKIEGREIIPTEETEFKEDSIYIIIDKSRKKGKIWIWSGSEAKSMDRYFAGVSATKIKSNKRLYGASIEVVEGGNEPDYFPDLKNVAIKEATEEKIKFEKIIVPVSEQEEIKLIKAKSKGSAPQVKSKQAPVQEVSKEEISKEKESKLLLKQNITSLLKEISLDMEKIQNKIQSFLNNL
ncbi:MAG: hypothetical protein ACFFBP_17570 [Promethearchaeota archaeon]